MTSICDEKWFACAVGAAISILTFIISNFLINKRQTKQDTKNLLLLIMQRYNKLFSLCYLAKNINENDEEETRCFYKNVRGEFENNFELVFIVPKKIQKDIGKLFEIHVRDSVYYTNNKKHIKDHLCKISEELMKYGVDFLGYK